MKITKIIGTTYLCSKFTNHDGTIVSDHPLYLFETNKSDLWLGVMFTQKTNPFTAKYPDGKDIFFTCCSDHKGEYPTRKVFQAEVYLINNKDKNLKYSEYTFANHYYNVELLKSLKNALKFNAIKSVHYSNNKENVNDMENILNELKVFVEEIVEKCYYNKCPAKGIANTTYSEFKKLANSNYTKKENRNVWKKSK